MPMHLENSIKSDNKIAWNRLAWYNWIDEKQLKLEAHAIDNSITQANQNDKQISKSIKRFITKFHISSALKAANAYKKKGISVVEVFQYLFLLIFSNRSMYMSLITRRNTPRFRKGHDLPLHEDAPDQLDSFYNPAGLPDYQERYCAFGFQGTYKCLYPWRFTG